MKGKDELEGTRPNFTPWLCDFEHQGEQGLILLFIYADRITINVHSVCCSLITSGKDMDVVCRLYHCSKPKNARFMWQLMVLKNIYFITERQYQINLDLLFNECAITYTLSITRHTIGIYWMNSLKCADKFGFRRGSLSLWIWSFVKCKLHNMWNTCWDIIKRSGLIKRIMYHFILIWVSLLNKKKKKYIFLLLIERD